MNANLRTASIAAAVVFVMVGLGFASVPLYRVFCQVTGLNGTTQTGSDAPGASGGKITVSFDSNVSPKLAWDFKPEQRSDRIDVEHE